MERLIAFLAFVLAALVGCTDPGGDTGNNDSGTDIDDSATPVEWATLTPYALIFNDLNSDTDDAYATGVYVTATDSKGDKIIGVTGGDPLTVVLGETYDIVYGDPDGPSDSQGNPLHDDGTYKWTLPSDTMKIEQKQATTDSWLNLYSHFIGECWYDAYWADYDDDGNVIRGEYDRTYETNADEFEVIIDELTNPSDPTFNTFLSPDEWIGVTYTEVTRETDEAYIHTLQSSYEINAGQVEIYMEVYGDEAYFLDFFCEGEQVE